MDKTIKPTQSIRYCMKHADASEVNFHPQIIYSITKQHFISLQTQLIISSQKIISCPKVVQIIFKVEFLEAALILCVSCVYVVVGSQVVSQIKYTIDKAPYGGQRGLKFPAFLKQLVWQHTQKASPLVSLFLKAFKVRIHNSTLYRLFILEA